MTSLLNHRNIYKNLIYLHCEKLRYDTNYSFLFEYVKNLNSRFALFNSGNLFCIDVYMNVSTITLAHITEPHCINDELSTINSFLVESIKNIGYGVNTVNIISFKVFLYLEKETDLTCLSFVKNTTKHFDINGFEYEKKFKFDKDFTEKLVSNKTDDDTKNSNNSNNEKKEKESTNTVQFPTMSSTSSSTVPSLFSTQFLTTSSTTPSLFSTQFPNTTSSTSLFSQFPNTTSSSLFSTRFPSSSSSSVFLSSDFPSFQVPVSKSNPLISKNQTLFGNK